MEAKELVKKVIWRNQNKVATSDLRFGNKVIDKDGEACTVNGIQKDWIWCEEKELTSITEFFGIPITEEWLWKLGFHCDRECNEYQITDGCEFTIGQEKSLSGHWFCYEITMDGFRFIRYVHELQNLYSACLGKELTT